MRRVFDLFPRLEEREKQKAGTMSGGEQQMLAIGRALMADPKLLLLDEPSMGIAPILVERIYETIAEINKQGTTILLVEQNANFALGRAASAATCWRPARSRSPTSSDALATTPRSRRRTWAHDRHRAASAPRRSSCCYVWLASAIVAQYLSDRKGYGEKPGLVTGLLLSVIAAGRSGCCGPAKADSRWKLQGPFGQRRRAHACAQMRADLDERRTRRSDLAQVEIPARRACRAATTSPLILAGGSLYVGPVRGRAGAATAAATSARETAAGRRPSW